jgi:dTDP-4-dehydrorhamnose reductase
MHNRTSNRRGVVVTGAAGMLGQAVLSEWPAEDRIVPMSRAEADLARTTAIDWIVEAAPAVIVHCAAWTDVDGCEGDVDRAFRDNGLATRNVALAAQRLGASLVYVSTDYVFDGSKQGPYREYDAPGPLGVYGRSKRWGEEVVQALVPQHAIVRTSWLFGPGGRNFVRTMAQAMTTRDSVRVVDDQRGSPTFTLDLARALVRLVDTGLLGTVHVSNSGHCTWFGLAQHVATRLGLSCRVEPCTTAEFPRPAPRPRNSVLDAWAWMASGQEALRPWQEAVDDYLEELRRQLAREIKAR